MWAGVGSHTHQLLVVKFKLQYTALEVSRWRPEVTAEPLRASSPRSHFHDGVKLSQLYFGLRVLSAAGGGADFYSFRMLIPDWKMSLSVTSQHVSSSVLWIVSILLLFSKILLSNYTIYKIDDFLFFIIYDLLFISIRDKVHDQIHPWITCACPLPWTWVIREELQRGNELCWRLMYQLGPDWWRLDDKVQGCLKKISLPKRKKKKN